MGNAYGFISARVPTLEAGYSWNDFAYIGRIRVEGVTINCNGSGGQGTYNFNDLEVGLAYGNVGGNVTTGGAYRLYYQKHRPNDCGIWVINYWTNSNMMWLYQLYNYDSGGLKYWNGRVYNGTAWVHS